jgi:holliday junction DNA helicase RuvA
MIATVSGVISEKMADLVVVESGGVGYGLFVTLEDQLKLKIGEKTKLYIYEHIRENTHDLYGFSEQRAKQLFEQLLDVNGVGPKMALTILSVGNVNEVREGIANGDVKLLQTAPGVGKRVAERVVVDLKDKIGLPSKGGLESLLISTASAQKDEAVQALVALGFNVPDAVSILSEIDKKLPTQERIKQALRNKA